MTENDLIKYVAANWPSIVTGMLVASVWLRLSRFTARYATIEKRVRRLMEICANQHPEKAQKLFDDEGAEK
jgi:hypothetical protein